MQHTGIRFTHPVGKISLCLLRNSAIVDNQLRVKAEPHQIHGFKGFKRHMTKPIQNIGLSHADELLLHATRPNQVHLRFSAQSTAGCER